MGFAAVLGRVLPPVEELERNRAAMALKTGAKAVTVEEHIRDTPPNLPRPDHGYIGTPEQPRHPDPVTEALRHMAMEGEALQAVGRLRSVRRADDIGFLICNGLDLSEGFYREPDDVKLFHAFMRDYGQTALDQYNDHCFEQFHIVPLGPRDMTRLMPELFEDEMAAKNSLRNGRSTLSDYSQGKYWREGQRKPSRFLRPVDWTVPQCEQALRDALDDFVRVEI